MISHPVNTALDVPCTLFGTLTFLLGQNRINMLECSIWVKLVTALSVSHPGHRILKGFSSLFGSLLVNRDSLELLKR